MTNDEKLMQRALELALEAHKALREWVNAVPKETPLPAMPGIDGDWLDDVEAIIREALAQQQEPMLFTFTVIDNDHPNGIPFDQWREKKRAELVPFYTAPQPHKPLTIAQIDRAANNIITDDPVQWWRQFARAVEAAHGIKEKNT